jgi:hypothetical protein
MASRSLSAFDLSIDAFLKDTSSFMLSKLTSSSFSDFLSETARIVASNMALEFEDR